MGKSVGIKGELSLPGKSLIEKREAKTEPTRDGKKKKNRGKKRKKSTKRKQNKKSRKVKKKTRKSGNKKKSKNGKKKKSGKNNKIKKKNQEKSRRNQSQGKNNTLGKNKKRKVKKNKKDKSGKKKNRKKNKKKKSGRNKPKNNKKKKPGKKEKGKQKRTGKIKKRKVKKNRKRKSGRNGKKNSRKNHKKQSKNKEKKSRKKQKKSKSGKNARKEKKGKGTRNNTDYMECFKTILNYAKITQRKGNNIEKQIKNVMRKQNDLNNKKAKKGEFKSPYKTLLDAMGGDAKNPKCNGKAVRNTTMDKPKDNLDTLNGCEAAIDGKCKYTIAEAVMTTMKECNTSLIKFRKEFEKCYTNTDIKMACKCIMDMDKDAPNKVQKDCDTIQTEQKNIIKKKRECQNEVKKCKKGIVS